jgi:hypothetical protein
VGLLEQGDRLVEVTCEHAGARQLLVNLVGRPQQRQLAQRGQVADAEIVAQRGVDPLRGVDGAVRHPAAQRLGRHVDEFHLVGAAYHLIGHGLPLGHAGDLPHHVVERLQVLDAQVRDHRDPGVEDFPDVLPAPGVLRPGDVGVRQLVD